MFTNSKILINNDAALQERGYIPEPSQILSGVYGLPNSEQDIRVTAWVRPPCLTNDNRYDRFVFRCEETFEMYNRNDLGPYYHR